MSRDADCHVDVCENTLPEVDLDDECSEPRPPAREVRFLDFKDIYSRVDVSHGPVDPSRVWLMFESQEAVIHLSVEEGIARRLFDRLGAILPHFREVRSRVEPIAGRR